MIPAVWVPPVHGRDLRALLSHRRRLISLPTTAKNHRQRVLHRLNLPGPAGDCFAHKHRTWWQALARSATERVRVDQDLATLDHVAPQIAAIDAELRRLRTSAPWADQVPSLIQVPGSAVLSAMRILGGHWRHSALWQRQATGGLRRPGCGVHARGTTHRDTGSTTAGRRDLRYVMVAAARSAVQTHPYWKRAFTALAGRIGEPKAMVAIACTLLLVVWHGLPSRSADRRAPAEQVAFKRMVWAWKLSDAPRGGLTSRQFIRYHLLRLGSGHDLTRSQRGGTPRPIAPSEEVLA